MKVLAGQRGDPRKILDEMQQASRERYISPVAMALVHSGMGEMDEAFRLLERGLDERTPWLSALVLDREPTNIALRTDPRWPAFARRVSDAVRMPAGSPPLVP